MPPTLSNRRVQARVELLLAGIPEGRIDDLTEDIADLLVDKYQLANREDSEMASMILVYPEKFPELRHLKRRLKKACAVVLPSDGEEVPDGS